MKYALIALCGALLSPSVLAQTVANGPYYAMPSWDQSLPAAQRFIVLANFNQQAVLDRETGLVWTRSPEPFILPWSAALTNCRNLIVAGKMGWRLPAVQELLSLVEAVGNPPVSSLPAGHPFQNITTPLEVWSINRLAIQPDAILTVIFNTTVAFGNFPTDADAANETNKYWCVRGGNIDSGLQ